MISFRHTETKERGVTLLIAIVIATVVLSLSFSIAAITTRSFVLSTAVRESQLAYYAGEAGSECARYWALRDMRNFSPSTNFTISCNGENFSWDTSNTDETFEFEFSHDYTDYLGTYVEYPYFTKVVVTRNPGLFNVDINSKGYNTDIEDAPKKYERRQSLNAYGICSYRPDIMFVIDLSSSVNATEMTQMKNAVKTFINTLNPTTDGVHIGLVLYGTTAVLGHHLTDDKAALIAVVDSIPSDLAARSDTIWGGLATNTHQGLRYAWYELNNRSSEYELAGWPGTYYCPFAAKPGRTIVLFDDTPVTNTTIADHLSISPEVPAGSYDITLASCESDQGSSPDYDPYGYGLRSLAAQSNEEYRMRLYDNSSNTGFPFLTTGSTNDLENNTGYAATTTLVSAGISIPQTARGFVAEHDPFCDGLGGNPAPGSPGCNHDVVPICAAFDSLDGDLGSDLPMWVTAYDRPDNESPDYVILLTDGGPSVFEPCRSPLPVIWDAHGGTFVEDPMPMRMARNAVKAAGIEASAVRASGADIFAVGIGTNDTNLVCPGYPGNNCSTFLNQAVASFATPDVPDSDGNAFYYDAANFTELDKVFQDIYKCIRPEDD